MKAYLYEGDTGKFAEAEIPADLKSAADEWRQKMIEDVSETDDELLEKFLDGKEPSTDELKKAIREGNPGTKNLSDSFRLAATPDRHRAIARCHHRLFAVAPR